MKRNIGPRSAGVKATAFAALRFGGFMSAEREQHAIARLREVLDARGLRVDGDPVVAYYDAPVVPPPLRRNEVLMRVE